MSGEMRRRVHVEKMTARQSKKRRMYEHECNMSAA